MTPGVAAAALVAIAPTLASSVAFTFSDPRIDESSGLVDLGRLMVTTNDSGGDPLVFVVDGRDGRTVATTTFAEEVEDVEALAPDGRGSVWVGDIGDNLTRRESVQVYRVPVGDQDQVLRSESFELVYPDGPHDAESLLYGPDGRLRIITKGLLGGRVYVAPEVLDPSGPNRLAAGPPVDFYATDAALFPDGKHVLVRGYGGALVATFPEFQEIGQFALPDQEQGEGVSIGSNGRIRISTEGALSDVRQVNLPEDVRVAMDAAGQDRAERGGLDDAGVVDAQEAAGLDWRWASVLVGLGLGGLIFVVAFGRRSGPSPRDPESG